MVSAAAVLIRLEEDSSSLSTIQLLTPLAAMELDNAEMIKAPIAMTPISKTNLCPAFAARH